VRRAALGGVLLLCGVALGGCGGSGAGAGARDGSAAAGATTTTSGAGSRTSPPSHTTRTTTTASAGRHHHHHHRPAPKVPPGPPVGRAQDVITRGSHLTVTITRVLALPHPGTALLPGTRAVGVTVTIDNHGPATYDSTASGDLSVVLSRGQAAPLDVRRGPCVTPLQDFESAIYVGAVRQGCVGFSVPVGARVLAARFSPVSRPPGTLTWRTGR
jgi:hypothetical protein